MIELGHFALILAMVMAVAITVAGLGTRWRVTHWLEPSLGFLTIAQFVLTGFAFATLMAAFANDDFSVAYVANHSNSALPLEFKLSAVWGGHEGSFLLWTLIMCVWMCAVVLRSAHLPRIFRANVLGTMGLMSVGFFGFLLFTSNPFERLVPFTPHEGADLNPLLQDFGLIVHPPMLYTGYVGFSVAFAFAIAALMSGRLDSAWARWSRPWTNVAWAFLTVGIALGSWWAYYELGWGGWWFWDPVENASFMPWLAGTALVHSLAATEKRGVFKSWTLLLAIAAFSLSLLGGFIVRSGVLTSVHAFAVDPQRGVYILAFLLAVVGGSLTLYGVRAWQLKSRAHFTWRSREFFLLLNNALFVIALIVVLVGTLYPLAYEALTGGDKLSVGKPYFDTTFVPLMLLVAAALGVAPALNFKRTNSERLRARLMVPMLVSLAFGAILFVWLDGLSMYGLLAIVLATWVTSTHARDLWSRASASGRPGLAYMGMLTAHIGFACSLIGVALTVDLSKEEDLAMTPGVTLNRAALTVTFEGTKEVNGPNYIAQQGRFVVVQGDNTYQLTPEKRRYTAGGDIMTEAAIDPGFFRDIYISLGDPLADGAWAVRLHYKPFVRWIWFGALLMALGGVLSVADRRYRARMGQNSSATNRTALLREIYQQRQAELALENKLGQVEQNTAQALAEELDINLLDEHQQALDPSLAEYTPPSRFIKWGSALAIPLLAGLIYAEIGDPTADRLINGNTAMSLPADDPALDGWRENLEARLAHRGDEEESWYLLAHIYLKEGRYARAATAFAQTDTIKPGDPVVRTYWLQARFLANDGLLDAEATRMAEELLALAPNNIAVTELLAVAYFRAGEFEKSSVLLARALEGTQSPQNRAQLSELLNQVRSHLPNASPEVIASQPLSSARHAVVVQVSSDAPPPQNATVFVVARPVGGGMPFAVERRSTNSLPFEVRLDDNNSMNPQMPLSKATEIEVVVRISLSGQAMAQPGDWAWVSQPLNVAQQTEVAVLDAKLLPP